jgi:hypothetical protein
MLRRTLAAVGKRLSSKKNSIGSNAPSTETISSSRRGFITKAAVGTVSITGTAGLAKVVVDGMEKPDLSDKYRKDSIAGEQELSEREYVLMTDQEKEEMVQQFVSDYHNET